MLSSDTLVDLRRHLVALVDDAREACVVDVSLDYNAFLTDDYARHTESWRGAVAILPWRFSADVCRRSHLFQPMAYAGGASARKSAGS